MIYKIMLFITVFMFTCTANAQNFDTRVNNLLYTLEKLHVSPQTDEDTLSDRVFTVFMDNVDKNAVYFTENQFNYLSEYRYDLISDVSRRTEFIDTVSALKRLAIKQINSDWISDITLKELTDNAYEIHFYNTQEVKRSKDVSNQELRFKKWFIFRVLDRCYSTYPELNLENKDSVNKALTYSLEQESRLFSCYFESMGFTDELKFKKSLEVEFLDAIALANDPHTRFYSKQDKEQLETYLSPSEETFGLTFYDDDNQIRVYSIHPMSDAWKSKLIHEDDIIKQVKDEDGKNLLGSCTGAYDLEAYLSSSEINSVELVIIKPNGEEKKVVLFKELLESEENNLIGYLLKGEKNIGYISLPSFYTSWGTNLVENGCANDVAKEIIKMKPDSISGLILDLRNNGGGSVLEAINLIGIFINEGPVAIQSDGKNKPKLLKDFNRGLIYDGPLVVLINGASASASEIVAAALKFHNRAIVVGGSSFGKATSQVVLPTDSTKWYFQDEDDNLDYVKITVGNIYQPNKKSHQLHGVEPHIKVPNLWSNYYDKEIDYKYPIYPPNIKKNIYFTVTRELPLDPLIAKSAERIEKDTLFNNIKKINDANRADEKMDYSIPLNLTSVYEYKVTQNAQLDQELEQSEIKACSFNFDTPLFYESIKTIDKGFKKNLDQLKIEIEKDPTLNETFLILTDFINLEN